MNHCHITNKIRYNTWDLAHEALTKIKRIATGKAPQRVYPCSFCSGFHLTAQEDQRCAGYRPRPLKLKSHFEKLLHHE